ncbi:hypothetical protein BaRGS_00018414, partial [Batillaria attramentaria]
MAGLPEQTRRWSEPVNLADAAQHVPVLVQLDEGYRGSTVETSISQGDIMALQSCTKVQGRNVVLAHYMREGDMEMGASLDGEIYRALIVLPLDNPDLAELQVKMLVDPEGEAYQNWVKVNFPRDNWKNRELEARQAVAQEDIIVYANLGPVKPAVKPRGPKPVALNKVPPEPPPKPSKSPDSPMSELETPPPRPPKPRTLGKSATLRAGASPSPVLPPRRTHSEDNDIYEVDEEGEFAFGGGLGLGFTFADMAIVKTDGDLPVYTIDDRPPAPIPPRETKKHKEHKEAGGGMLKKLTENIYKKFAGPPKATDTNPAQTKPQNVYYSDANLTGAKPSQPAGKQKPGKPTMQVYPVQTSPPSSPMQPPLHAMMAPASEERGLQFPPMETMSVKQLCNCLEMCGMPKFAQTCRQERLDGRFLLSLSDETLMGEPFSLIVIKSRTQAASSRFIYRWRERVRYKWRPIRDFWSDDTYFWSDDTDFWSDDTDFWSDDTDFWSDDTYDLLLRYSNDDNIESQKRVMEPSEEEKKLLASFRELDLKQKGD